MDAKFRTRLSPEFVLVAACSHWPLTPEALQRVADAAKGVVWRQFARVARRQRVEGLVWHALRKAEIDVPDDVARELKQSANRIATQNLRIIGETARLQARFAEAGIPLLFVKGVALAKLAYGTPALKAGWDIDILIPEYSVRQAATLLADLGYRLTYPESCADPDRLPAFHRVSKESVWWAVNGDFHVELHTQRSDNRRLLPAVGMASPTQNVEIARGIVIPTLEKDSLFAYLCVHGASSAWFRLKWMADLVALLDGENAEEIERLYYRSQQLGAGRAAGQALLLAESLFELQIGERLHRQLSADRGNKMLAWAALRQMNTCGGAIELDDILLGTALIHLSQLWLLPGTRFKLSEVRRQILGTIGPRAG